MRFANCGASMRKSKLVVESEFVLLVGVVAVRRALCNDLQQLLLLLLDSRWIVSLVGAQSGSLGSIDTPVRCAATLSANPLRVRRL